MGVNILLLGSGGQLGIECKRSLSPLGNITCLDYPEIDFTKPEQLETIIEEHLPNVIVNCAAYTAVDQAESDRQRCELVNAISPGVIAEIARRHEIALIHISTDFVFDGSSEQPYTEENVTNPLSYYGETKLAGEKAVQQSGGANLILRTAWLYSLWTDSFVVKVLRWARQRKSIRVVSDQIGNPTPAFQLADAISMVIYGATPNFYHYLLDRSGVYHVASSGYTSRYDWAKEIIRLDPNFHEQSLVSIESALGSEFPTPAQRPSFSALNCEKFHNTFGISLPNWKQGLAYLLRPKQ